MSQVDGQRREHQVRLDDPVFDRHWLCGITWRHWL
jgi:hypothetical protein